VHSLAAAQGDTAEVRRELARSLRLGLLISFTGCGAAAVMAPFIIPLFYSRAFAGAGGLMIAYMPGELCFQLFSMLVAYQLTVSLRRIYVALNLGYIALLVGAGVMLIPTLGAGGYVAAHVGSSFLIACATLLVASNRGQIESSLVVMATLLIIGLTAVSAILFSARGAGYLTLALLPLLIPFAISGTFLLKQLWRDRAHRPEPATE